MQDQAVLEPDHRSDVHALSLPTLGDQVVALRAYNSRGTNAQIDLVMVRRGNLIYRILHIVDGQLVWREDSTEEIAKKADLKVAGYLER